MTSPNGAVAHPHQELIAGAKTLIDKVEFDVNGTHGKGGNGGLTSDETIRSAGELRIILSRMSGHPVPADRLGGGDLTNEQKEITLLRIIDAMGGKTDSSDYPGCWLTWFCSDEIHNVQDDTFNRCNNKGWLHTTHDTSFDTSTTTLTPAGRAALKSGGSADE